MLLAFAVLLVSAAGTALARTYALRRRLLDEPGERRSHSIATPRGGGAGPVAGVLLAMSVMAWRDASASPWLAAAGLLAVAAIGAWDDHRPLSARLRLAVHGVASIALAFAIADPADQPLLFLVTCVIGVVLVNVWNFMDGIDGIAASQAVVVAVAAFAIGGWSGAGVAPAVAAACLGFLPFNLPRARIFLGDVGSGALGFALAYVVADTARRAPADGLRLLLPLSPFFVDSGMTLARRILRGERWWEAHAQHLYQGLARRHGHGPVTVGYTMAAAVAAVVAMSVPSRQPGFTMTFLALWYGSAAVLWLWLQRLVARAANRE